MSWQWVAVVEFAWVAAVTIWIVHERRAPTATIAWIVSLAALPLIGVPIYLLIGPRHLTRRRVRYAGRTHDLRRAVEGTRTPLEIPPDAIKQIRIAQSLDHAPLTTATRLATHHDGAAAFAALEKAIAAARETVHVEFYIWDRDATGARLRDLLAEKARSGVSVRVIVDGVGAKANRRFMAPLAEAGGRIVQFNPPRLAIRSRWLNFRTHRKIIVIDGRHGFIGGMNVSDSQTVGRDGAPPWRDSMLEVEGRVVAGLQRAFFENWCFACEDEFVAEDRYFPQLPAGEHWMQVVRSGPDRDVYPIHELLFSAITSADERVWIACPYLVPDEPIFTAIRSAAHRGVDVRLLVSKRSDSRLVDAAVRSFYEDWLAAKVRVFEYGPAMLHAKTVVVDRELAVIGSANLDNRSFRLNFEIVGAMYGEEMADALAATFERDLASADEVAPDSLERRGQGTLFAQNAARLFAIQL